MFPIDRRKLARHVYSILGSLRKTGTLLQVSHSTVARWLKNCERAPYKRASPKGDVIAKCIRSAIANDPFLSVTQLKNIVQNTFQFNVSRELVRTIVLKCGFTYKKARYFSQPSGLATKTAAFLEQREKFKLQGRPFLSIDESSFGRRGIVAKGYAPKGARLIVKRNVTRMTTTSVLAAVSEHGIVATEQVDGSFNTQ